jgi:hypothetical protein
MTMNPAKRYRVRWVGPPGWEVEEDRPTTLVNHLRSKRMRSFGTRPEMEAWIRKLQSRRDCINIKQVDRQVEEELDA